MDEMMDNQYIINYYYDNESVSFDFGNGQHAFSTHALSLQRNKHVFSHKVSH